MGLNKDSVTIAHLYQLQCDSSEAWVTHSECILTALLQISPDILIISGSKTYELNTQNIDCVDQFFSKIKKDVFSLKKRIIDFSDEKIFKEEGLAIETYKEFKVFIFSCGRKINKENNLYACNGFEEAENMEVEKHGDGFCDAIKIVVYSDFGSNVGCDLLNVFIDNGVDVMLHGVDKVSGLYKIEKFDEFVDRSKVMIMMTCRSSANIKNNSSEIVLIRRTMHGELFFNRYLSIGGVFNNAVRNRVSLCQQNASHRGIEVETKDTTNSFIQNVNRKSKIIKIEEDNSAKISVYLMGVLWKDDLLDNKRFIKERIRCDLGRVREGKYTFNNDGFFESGKYENFINDKWDKISNIFEEPYKPDLFDKDLIANSPDSFFHLEVELMCGYALNGFDYKEMYISRSDASLPEEYANISVDYPTDELELIIYFPEQYFPPTESFEVQAYRYVKTYDDEDKLNILYGDSKYIDNEESCYLKEKDLINFRPEINEVSMIIKKPRIDIEYVLRWGMKGGDDSEYVQDNIDLSRMIVDQKSKSIVMSFYNHISACINKQVFNDKKYMIILFGYDPDDKKLIVIGCPHEFNVDATNNIFIGRGPEGKAFQQRQYYRWDDKDKVPWEEVIVGLKPKEILALPMIFPKLIGDNGKLKSEKATVVDGIYIKKRDRHFFPVWGCISIVSATNNNFNDFTYASAISPAQRNNAIDAIKSINLIIKKSAEAFF